MSKFKFLLFAAAALLPTMPACAQSEPPEYQSEDEGDFDPAYAVPIKRDIVVVASGVEQSAAESGRSVTLIQRDEIETRQAIAISDLLATTPGITVTRNGGLGGFTGVRIRGAEGEQTLVLIDGVRVNDPSSPGGGFDFANLLAGAVDRVEVLRGPNSIVWGSQAIGGVVNVVTTPGSSDFGLHANAEYGSLDSRSASAAIHGGNDTIKGAFTAGYLETDGISAAAIGTEPDGYRQYGASGRVEVAFAPGFALDLRGYYADSRAYLDGFQSVAPYGFIDTAEYSTAEELYGYAGLRAELFDRALTNRLSVTVADIDRDNFDPAFGSARSFFGHGSSERYAYQGDARLSPRARLVFGAEHEDSRFTDGFTPANTGITSFYGQAIVTPIETLTLTGGVRHDDHRDFGRHTTFGISAALRPAARTAIHASYGEGFKAPTLYQLHGSFGTATLQPETAQSYEIGAQQEIGGAKLSAVWFHRDTVNQIDFDLGTFSYGNIARARSEGAELGLEAKLGWLTLRGAFTHLKAENRLAGPNFGNDLARRPRDSGSLSADYSFDFGLGLGATLLVSGGSFDNAANTVRLDGYAVLGLRAEFAVSDQVMLYGRIDNVFDEQYQTVAGYGTMGRAAYAGVRVKLD